MTSRAVVLATLRAFPRGRSVGEILDHLGRRGSREVSAAVNRELHGLAREGSVTVGEAGRWRLTSWQAATPLSVEPATLAEAFLRGVPASARRVAPSALEELGPVAAKPDPQALLRYYRSALRSDPRGAMTEVPDRHATVWQVLACSGPWWPADGESACIEILLSAFADTFRQALARRSGEETALAVGWPLSVGERDGVPVIRPIGLLTATWSQDSSHLRVDLGQAVPVANPDWLKAEGRRLGWSGDTLRQHLEGSQNDDGGVSTFSRRLREAAASQIRGGIDPLSLAAGLDLGRPGVANALAIFLPTDQTFTAGAVADLDQIAAWPATVHEATALGPLLAGRGETVTGGAPPLHATSLNAEQIEAVQNAAAPLSVVTGPPGTGKTQTILAMVTTALANGESILVASRNHQALDAVEERLLDLLGDPAAVVRTLDPDEGRDIGLREVLRALVAAESGGPAGASAPLAEAIRLARRRDEALGAMVERRRLQLRIAEHLDRLPDLESLTPAAPSPARLSLWRRLLLRLDRSEPREPEVSATVETTRRALVDDRAFLAALLPPADDPVALAEEVAAATRAGLRAHVAARLRPEEGERTALANAQRDIELHGRADSEAMAGIAQRVLACRPVWLASVLGAPRRIPLAPALFDLVIFDEASQCDIAASLPLLARARRAVVVGDDRQLSMIPGLGPAQDRNLMAAQGLPNRGMGRWAQGLNSLFDLAQSTPGVPRALLRDQFRSAPGITDYISGAFYGGRLRVAVDEERLRPVPGLKPGLHWTDVPGTSRPRPDGGTSNPAEAAAIVQHLTRILVQERFQGSVGVVTPFNAQVAEIREALRGRIPAEIADRAELRVATVDRFQGQERDLMIISPVLCGLSPQSARSFVARDWRRINVAVSRARSVAHVMGDLSFARVGGIDSLRILAARATGGAPAAREGEFDSEWERILYHAMVRRGWEPLPQHPVAGRRLDFALRTRSGDWLDVEVDGRRWHQDIDGNRKADDLWRDHRLRALGWRVRRFWVDELNRDLEGCLDLIANDLA